MNRVEENITIENAHIFYRNFSGTETQYNRAGDRNFCVRIDDPEFAMRLREDGWNVKVREARIEGGEDSYYLQVTVRFDIYPPKVVLITRRRQQILNEETVKNLDYAEIKNVDLIIRPRNWVTQEGTRNEKRGVKAYLKTMYVTIEEDAFSEKYADLDISM